MLLPRGLTKKKVDPISARRRKIEDKERPFTIASEPKIKEDKQLEATKNDLQSIWSNAVFVSLSEHRFSREDVRVSRTRKPGYTSCETCIRETGISNVAPTELVSAIRNVASDLIEIRLALQPEEDATPGCAFEFRLRETFAGDSIEDGKRIAYLESVPAPYQSVVGITNLVHQNLANTRAPGSPLLRGIVPISLTPKNEPSFEQVMISFSDEDCCNGFLDIVPWHNRAVTGRHPAFCDCIRACSFQRFKELKEEYVQYQTEMRSKLEPALPEPIPEPAFASLPAIIPARHVPPPRRTNDRNYPPNRLLFLRNVSVTSNKTAIRADMVSLLGEASVVDYVDWSKGNDTAHIRLSNAIDNETLDGLIERGNLEGDLKVELMSGERESIYWSRLPEKIRIAAMNT